MANKKLTTRQKELKRDYMRLYNKLDLYGQAPITPLSNPWKRDIDRLKARWETVKSYARIYNNYQKAVAEFNATYLQNVQAVQPHTAINTRTLEYLKKTAREFRKQRNEFIKKIQHESDIIAGHLIDIVKDAFNAAHTTHINTFTGQLTAKGQEIESNAIKVNRLIKQYFPIMDYNAIQRIKQMWEILIYTTRKFIYDSESFEGEKAALWQNIVNIISNGKETPDIDYYNYEVELWE